MTGRKAPARIINRTHRYYSRWFEMCKRCHDPLSTHYARYGGLGIRVDWEWNPDNPNGLANFNLWLTNEIYKNPTISKPRLTRKDKKGNFNSDNCFISTGAEIVQNKVGVVLSVELVADMRKFKKANPEMSGPAIARHFNVPSSNIGSALTGVTWANVNLIEAPLPPTAMADGYRLRKQSGATQHEKQRPV